jgi:hypothetical protein
MTDDDTLAKVVDLSPENVVAFVEILVQNFVGKRSGFINHFEVIASLVTGGKRISQEFDILVVVPASAISFDNVAGDGF